MLTLRKVSDAFMLQASHRPVPHRPSFFCDMPAFTQAIPCKAARWCAATTNIPATISKRAKKTGALRARFPFL
jgi:hypothetical protein